MGLSVPTRQPSCQRRHGPPLHRHVITVPDDVHDGLTAYTRGERVRLVGEQGGDVLALFGRGGFPFPAGNFEEGKCVQ